MLFFPSPRWASSMLESNVRGIHVEGSRTLECSSRDRVTTRPRYKVAIIFKSTPNLERSSRKFNNFLHIDYRMYGSHIRVHTPTPTYIQIQFEPTKHTEILFVLPQLPRKLFSKKKKKSCTCVARFIHRPRHSGPGPVLWVPPGQTTSCLLEPPNGTSRHFFKIL